MWGYLTKVLERQPYFFPHTEKKLMFIFYLCFGAHLALNGQMGQEGEGELEMVVGEGTIHHEEEG